MPDPMHGLEEELDRLYEGTVLPGPVVGPFAEDVHPAPRRVPTCVQHQRSYVKRPNSRPLQKPHFRVLLLARRVKLPSFRIPL